MGGACLFIQTCKKASENFSHFQEIQKVFSSSGKSWMGNKNSKKKKDKGGDKKGAQAEVKPETYNFKNADPANRIFGVDIQEVLKRFNIENMKSLPPPIAVLMNYIEHNIHEKQVFKRDGAKTAVNVLNYKIDTGAVKGEDDCGTDIHVVVANLKKYIRELPGGLLPYAEFAPLGDIEDQNELVGKMKEAMGKMNETHLFFYFHISRVLNLAMNNGDNEMGLVDLTQVFRMNLMEMDATDAKYIDRVKRLCDATIEKFTDLFPNPDEFPALSQPKKEEEEVEGEAAAPVEPAPAAQEEQPPAVEEPPAEEQPPAVEEQPPAEEPAPVVEEEKVEEPAEEAPVEEQPPTE